MQNKHQYGIGGKVLERSLLNLRLKLVFKSNCDNKPTEKIVGRGEEEDERTIDPMLWWLKMETSSVDIFDINST